MPSHQGVRRRSLLTAGLAVTGLAATTSCGGSSGGGQREDVTIAYQPGLGYAPLLVAKEQKLLEEKLPDITVNWKELNSGAAIRDGIVADEIQVGSMGTGPFLVGWSNGVGWKVIAALDNMNLQLMVRDKEIENLSDLRDLGAEGKIAMPAPDSIQAIILRRAAAEELGDAEALDAQIVSMGHPDGVQALTAGQIAGHLTAPPFQEQEREADAHAILDSYDLFGEHTFNSVYARESFVEDNADIGDALREVIQESVELLRDDPERAAEILAREDGSTPPAEMAEQVTDANVEFTTRPHGFAEFTSFMKEIDLIDKEPDEVSELFFDNELTEGGS